ncbi:hypothetical protein DEA98_13030 [Brucella pseudogrignonensis]|nr:hypothetical protein [Brucella pseudogrignonensis]
MLEVHCCDRANDRLVAINIIFAINKRLAMIAKPAIIKQTIVTRHSSIIPPALKAFALRA